MAMAAAATFACSALAAAATKAAVIAAFAAPLAVSAARATISESREAAAYQSGVSHDSGASPAGLNRRRCYRPARRFRISRRYVTVGPKERPSWRWESQGTTSPKAVTAMADNSGAP